MATHANSEVEFVYMHFLVIYDLGALTTFTMFEYEVLKTINTTLIK